MSLRKKKKKCHYGERRGRKRRGQAEERIAAVEWMGGGSLGRGTTGKDKRPRKTQSFEYFGI